MKILSSAPLRQHTFPRGAALLTQPSESAGEVVWCAEQELKRLEHMETQIAMETLVQIGPDYTLTRKREINPEEHFTDSKTKYQ